MGGEQPAQARRGRLSGKVISPLNKMLEGVEWGKFRVGDFFDIESTASFNKDSLTIGLEYDYVTRTSKNQGILQTTGFVNKENVNPAGTWSLGLLQMDFFYRQRPWYAGQFVRKVTPKINLSKNSILFITSALNKNKNNLLSVLVRNVDDEFKSAYLILPSKKKQIDFGFIDRFIAELEAESIAELETYLAVTGLKDYELTIEEQKALDDYHHLEFNEFNVIDIFTVKNTRNILSRDIIENSGHTPYLCASSEDNGVSSYIDYDNAMLEEGNCIFIGGKTFVVSYQKTDFFSNDSHNLVLYLKQSDKRTRLNQLYLAACVNKSLGYQYSWGDSISNKKIQTDKVSLPAKANQPDFDQMAVFISAIQKLVIKDVVLFAERNIESHKNVLAPI